MAFIGNMNIKTQDGMIFLKKGSVLNVAAKFEQKKTAPAM
jgi:hypothetical protein